MHVDILGPLRVRDADGADLDLPGARERAGLAVLAILAPDPVSTERLAAELYGDRETADPRNAVQAVVSRLRKGLGRSSGSIETTTNGYRLVDVTLDVDAAVDLLSGAMTATEPSEAESLLSRARELWRGETLAGLTGRLLDAERVRIDGLRADAEDAVLELLAAGPSDHGLVARFEGAVHEQPLREKRWELLMLALYRSGRQADALRAYQRARNQLADQLGLEPGPALAELEARILAHDPTLAAPAGRAEPGPLRPSPGARPAPTSQLPAGTVTVLLCDVEGSVRRWEAAPDDTARDIAGMHAIWTAAVASAGGQVIKSTGDGLMAVFATSAASLTAAAAALARQDETGLIVRAAVNTGSMEPTPDGDYRGPVVNRCARLLDLAHGGQILVAGASADLARAELPAGDVRLVELGLHWLRDVPEPLPVWQVTGPGIPSSFPPLRARGPDSVPRPRSELLGRSELVAETVERVGDERLVTLLGPGGIGKTSIAIATAWELVGVRPVVFVDLARVGEPTAVAHRIADEVAPTDHEAERGPTQRIADRLGVNTDLIVIDNAEHLLDGVATVLDELVRQDLKGSFLVTSRQPLGVAGETIVGVPPLALPEDDADLDTTGQTPSVRLFVDRVRAARPDVELPTGLLPVVAHICRRLDGIPLAIELAAGRASVLSVDDIAARLDDQLRLLRQVRSSRERRHRSLEAVVGWSVDQLSPAARELFDRLSVMAGSFGLDGVERLLAECGVVTIDVLDELDELRGASLLAVEPEGSRFRMLEPIRQLAATELAERGLELETKRAHVRWLTEVMRSAHLVRTEERAAVLERIDADGDQVRAAVSWLGEGRADDLIGDLAYYSAWWFLTRDAREGERLLRRLVPLVDADRDRLEWAKVVLALGIASVAHPRFDVADSALEALAVLDAEDHPDVGLLRVIAAFAQAGGTDPGLPLRLVAEAEQRISSDDRWATAVVDMATMVLHGLLPDEYRSDLTVDVTVAVGRGERAAAAFRSLSERWALGVTLGELGRIHQRVGDIAAAEACYAESIELFAGSDYHGVHYIFTELGRLASARREHDLAETYHRQAREIADEYGHPGCVALSIAGLADSAEARGDVDRAVELYRHAVGIADREALVEFEIRQWRAALARLEALADRPGQLD